MEIHEFAAVNEQGSLSHVKLCLTLVPQPTCTVRLEGAGIGVFSGGSLFAALIEVRLALEERGLLLCCQGCRPNVFTSGQLEQFSGGRRAYVLTTGQLLEDAPVVEVLSPAGPDEVATVAEQRLFVFDFFGLRDRFV